MASGSGVQFQVDLTYGGVYAGTSFEFSQEVVDHFNQAAEQADGLVEGEYLPFEEGDYFSIACPMADKLNRRDFVRAYHELDARIDGTIDLHLGDFPRLLSNDAEDTSRVRAVPTYIPKSVMGDDFFGKPHQVELLQNGSTLFGPEERFFHSRTSGPVFSQIEDGQGRLVVEIRNLKARPGQQQMVVFFTDPVFGVPTAATQIDDSGATRPLAYQILGKDHVGDVFLFNEGVVSGVDPRGDLAVVELFLPHRGSGLAAALYAGHTRDLAFRTDATVL